MTISDQQNSFETITIGAKALECFTDRREMIRLFLEYVNVDPLPAKILFFYGDGGNGKSLLLNFLRKFGCKRYATDDWEYIQQAGEDGLPKLLKETVGEEVPSVSIDFGAPPFGEDQPQDRFWAIRMIRKQLMGKGLAFPRYDFACAWYSHKTGRTIAPLPQIEELDLVTTLTDAISKTPYATIAGAVLNLFSKHLGQKATLYFQKLKLDEGKVREIQSMDPEILIDCLPQLFAQDLNTALALSDIKRLVFFFDTYEAFWGDRRDLSSYDYFERDQWLRTLLRNLAIDGKIVVVVTGRELPRWDSAAKEKIGVEYVASKHIACFTDYDAREYLKRAGVDPRMHRAMLDTARESPDQVHPFYLGFCVDVWQAARVENKELNPGDLPNHPDLVEKRRQLRDRLLKYVNQGMAYAIRTLSVCRFFDEELYYYLGEKLHFQADQPSFQNLINFSFVRKISSKNQARYQIHDLLRRLIVEGDWDVGAVDKVLKDYYEEKVRNTELELITEEVYHTGRIDWEEGVEEWTVFFQFFLGLSVFLICDALLEVSNLLILKSDYGYARIVELKAEYYQVLSRYNEAEKSFREAISLYERAVVLEPCNSKIYNNKGNALLNLGDLLAVQSKHEEVLKAYQAAIEDFNQALSHAPDDIHVYGNKGNALQSLGDLLAIQSQYEEALKLYQAAIDAYDRAFSCTPYDYNVHNGKGKTLQSLGDLLADQSNHEEALKVYWAAIEAFDRALACAPDFTTTYNNKGNALHCLGNLLAVQSQYEEALKIYQAAIEVFDEALSRTPNYINAYINKGSTLKSLGDLLANHSRQTEALEIYQAAIEAFNLALSRTPDNIDAYNNKGIALHRMGNLLTAQLQHAEALEIYKAAIEAFNQALSRAPDHIFVYNNKGNTLQSLGNLLAAQLQNEEALKEYQTAIETYERALSRAPDQIHVNINKGRALQNLGDILVSQLQHEEASKAYKAAINAYDQVLSCASNDIFTYNYKGNVLQSLGNLLVDQSKYEEALKVYRVAIETFDQALSRAPDNNSVFIGKGLTLQRLGYLLIIQSQYEEALKVCHTAIETYDHVLLRSPENIQAINNKKVGLEIIEIITTDQS